MKQCDNGHFFDEKRFASCPYCTQAQPMGKTVAMGHDEAGANPAAAGSLGKTVGVMKKTLGIDPAVGFLVCVSGPHRGEDFKLVAGRNFIGRSAGADVALTEDETVSRENHAIVSYDAKSNGFMAAPGTSRGITYLNGAQVESAVKLSAYDRLEVGACVLLFLPLCSERFQWEGQKDAEK